MFKKDLVLTTTTCRLLEGIHLTLEVLKGTPIRFKQLRLEKGNACFGSGEGSFFLGEEEIPISFTGDPEGKELYLQIKIGETWYVARFDSPRKVRVTKKYGSTHSEPGMWVVGTSATDRHEEPLFPLPPIEE